MIFRRYAELGSVALLKAELDRLGVVSKRREGAGGCLAGGKPFSRGALYLLLQNRIYRGEITHQDAAYPGQHDAIIDAELWRIVQDKLATNRRERSLAAGAEAPSLLAGLIFDADGDRMTPTHAAKAQQAISILCLGVASHRRSRCKPNRDARSSGRHRRTCAGSAATIFCVKDGAQRRPRAARSGCSQFRRGAEQGVRSFPAMARHAADRHRHSGPADRRKDAGQRQRHHPSSQSRRTRRALIGDDKVAVQARRSDAPVDRRHAQTRRQGKAARHRQRDCSRDQPGARRPDRRSLFDPEAAVLRRQTTASRR